MFSRNVGEGDIHDDVDDLGKNMLMIIIMLMMLMSVY